jgi:hypothetical protein
LLALINGSSKHILNVGQLLPDYTAQQQKGFLHARSREKPKAHFTFSGSRGEDATAQL